MCQACLLIINYINELQLERPNQPPPACGNHAQERSHRVPGGGGDHSAQRRDRKYQVRQQLTRRW